MDEKNNQEFQFEEIKDNYVIEDQPKPNEVDNSTDNDNQPKTNTLAIASMILGILSLVCCCIGFYPFMAVFPIVSGVLAIVFGAASRKGKSGNGFATAGLICGIAGVCIAVLSTIFWIVILILGITSEADPSLLNI
ncbi:MAG: DUF4190 domain-containing protein [Clostridia bacterium]|nr:DUF4190 domain-containing protein [Clostridia bacterium]